jgi:hypothetical protein
MALPLGSKPVFDFGACIQDLLLEMQQGGTTIGGIQYTRHHIRAF